MEGKIITNQEDIFEEVKSFDINLYENKNSCLEGVDMNKVRHGYNIPKLNSVMKEKVESNMSREENLTPSKGMKNRKISMIRWNYRRMFQTLLVRFMQIH